MTITTRTISAATITALAIAFSGPAQAADQDTAIDTVNGIAPEVFTDSADLDYVDHGDSLVDQVVAGVGIDVPRDAGDGAVTFDNNNDTSTVPVVKDDGSVQVLTTIEGTDAPTRFDYDLTLPAGATLSLDEYGGAYVLAADGVTLVTAVAAAWAEDANGNPIPTHYEVSGSSLTQVVEHRANSTAYPVVAGILVVGASAVWFCNAAGRGININVFWSGWVTCTSR
ncbi:hypothetical protein RN607_10310 [Demequina capsici]|uniref:Uncharacterized protein n=1 Tax=Demequina capsici TaxID=3075620 RepID=A0AA96FC07_9MICO|nr:hypothetical protein [Demequina sp. PMTSA13]WNM26590.1 hypothetical protein RN607_10310 [Demequina sp. PMTSA13]